MKNTILPTHAVTGLQALGWRKPRPGESGAQPIWPIMGASPDNDEGDSGQDDGDDGTDDDAEDGNAGDGKDGGTDDEPDWKAKFEAQQRISRNLEKRSRKDKALIDKLSGKQQPAGKQDDDKDDPDPEKIRAEARAEAAAEALKGRVVDKIEAKAAKFADPEDAAAILLRGKDVDDFIDDGKIDVESIKDALDELAEKKPHLLAQGKRFQGGADGGARQSKTARPKDLGEALARHYRAK